MSADRGGEQHGTQLIGRVARLLRSIPRGHPTGQRLSRLAEAAGLSQPTARRILKALIREQFVVQDADTKLYRIGPLAFELGLATNYHAELIERCRPYLRELAQESGDNVSLYMRSGNDAVCIERLEGTYPIRAAVVEIGDRVPLGIGVSGIAILSTLSDDEIDAILADLGPTIATYEGRSVPEIRERAVEAREAGYALSAAVMRHVPGVRGASVVVRPPEGSPVSLAISVFAIDSRMTLDQVPITVRALKRTAERISAALPDPAWRPTAVGSPAGRRRR